MTEGEGGGVFSPSTGTQVLWWDFFSSMTLEEATPAVVDVLDVLVVLCVETRKAAAAVATTKARVVAIVLVRRPLGATWASDTTVPSTSWVGSAP